MAYCTIAELAYAAHTRVTAENTAFLQACVDAAAVEIDHEIDAPDAIFGTYNWDFVTVTTVADPGVGCVSLNHSNPQQATAVSLDTLDAAGVDHQDELVQIMADDFLFMQEPDTARWQGFRFTAPPIDRTGWLEMSVEWAASTSPAPSFKNLEQLMLTAGRSQKPLGDPLANRVNVARAYEWFKAQDAAFGVVGFAETGALQAPRDGFNRHAYELTPLKRQWGIA